MTDAAREILVSENRELRAQVAELRAALADAQSSIERLTAALEEARRGGKRQAAPFRKPQGPKPEPKKPGRKSGDEHGPHAHRTAPSRGAIDERHDVPLPRACPHCGKRHLEETHVAVQYQTEIPR